MLRLRVPLLRALRTRVPRIRVPQHAEQAQAS